ncbi:MAG: YccF domain-containing protein, partial [Desulfotignum sp.]
MTLILNILWFIFGGGFVAWLMWILTGGLLFITVVGIPFAWAAFRIAGFAAFPFGKDLV